MFINNARARAKCIKRANRDDAVLKIKKINDVTENA
jgi:hypothetical protein